MAKRKWIWAYSPKKAKPPKISDKLKDEISEKAEKLVEEFKATYIQEKPTDHDFNYRVNIYTKWYQSYFYFCSTFNCPSPRAIAPSFEYPFTRLTYLGDDKFTLSYFRHTGKWQEVYEELSLEECFETIRKEQIFHP